MQFKLISNNDFNLPTISNQYGYKLGKPKKKFFFSGPAPKARPIHPSSSVATVFRGIFFKGFLLELQKMYFFS